MLFTLLAVSTPALGASARPARRRTVLAISVSLLMACSNKEPPSEIHAAPPAAVAANTPVAAAQTTPEEKILNIRNWPDYIPEGMIAAFESETGIKVNYKTYKNNEELMESLSSGKSNDDLVVPSSNFATLQIDKGLLRPLDKSLLPGLSRLDPATMTALVGVDPGNRHLIPWAWGFTTVGINATKVKAALGGTAMPGNAWDLVFNPSYTSKLKQCGIAFLDSPTEVIPAALHHIGKPVNSVASDDLKAVADMLSKVRPDIKTFSNTLIDELASGKACVVLGWNGDINSAKSKAADAGLKDQIETLLPSKGGLLFIDTLAIPAAASHPKNAHTFIEFFLRPENAARISNELGYPSGNQSANDKIDPSVLQDPSVFPGAKDMQRMMSPAKLDLASRIVMTQTYVTFAYGASQGGKKTTTP